MNLSQVKKTAATGLEGNQFVGIRIKNNKVEFCYPETFSFRENSSESEQRRDILAVLKTIELAKTLAGEESSYNSKNRSGYAAPLKSFLWLINDYLTYGAYVNIERSFEKGIHGKINWKKTMRSNPVISNGNIVYPNIVSERKSQVDNLLTEIYLYCVEKSIEAFGWIYNLSFDNHGLDFARLFSRQKYITAINSELSHSFNDLKKIRLLNMRDVILGLDDKSISANEFTYGVDSYEFVFEKMIDSMFSGTDSKKDFYPTAFWDLVYPEEKKGVKSSNLRPDTISIKNKSVFVLDAKYYRYGTTHEPGDLPETTSIEKQITYGEYIRNCSKKTYDEVLGAFLMPYNKGVCDDNIKYIGAARAAWPDEDRKKKIAGILIDTRFLVENWTRGSNKTTFDELTKMIEDHIKDVETKSANVKPE